MVALCRGSIETIICFQQEQEVKAMSSYEYDDACVQAFLEQQLQLFPEEVAETPEEAEAFLEDCMAVVCDDKQEVISYLEEEMDITGMDEDEILKAEEVFAIGDGRYLVVEG